MYLSPEETQRLHEALDALTPEESAAMEASEKWALEEVNKITDAFCKGQPAENREISSLAREIVHQYILLSRWTPCPIIPLTGLVESEDEDFDYTRLEAAMNLLKDAAFVLYWRLQDGAGRTIYTTLPGSWFVREENPLEEEPGAPQVWEFACPWYDGIYLEFQLRTYDL